METSTIPPFVLTTIKRMQDAGFEAYLVGGCVRDMVMGRTPKDWDVTTNARPGQIQETLADLRTLYETSSVP